MMKLSEYRETIIIKSAYILINYCLVIYAGLDENYKNSKDTWKSELKGLMVDLALDKLSKNNTAENRAKQIRKIWLKTEYDQPESIRFRICGKFDEENIDTESNNFYRCAEIFSERMDEIIAIIASGNEDTVVEYVKNL